MMAALAGGVLRALLSSLFEAAADGHLPIKYSRGSARTQQAER
jgi:hypothetical protein